ncbi:hypothetical protein D1007_22130 [Hordeum vulgare]|nr:hypothetical protein D1007_22130 [Hordeum vulgare]
MSKTSIYNWAPSQVSEELLQNYVNQSLLSSKELIRWRVPQGETHPNPNEGEVMVFIDHLLRGFSPPGSTFFRDAFNFVHLHPQDLDPNSISNLCQFQVLCEVYLQMEPGVPLF